MASIEKRPNGRYRARWREEPRGPQKSRHFTRKADAERFLDGIRGDLARGTYIDPAAGRLHFQDYAEQWRQAQIHRLSTSRQCERYLRIHAYPVLGPRPLGAVRRSEVQAWVKGRSEVLSPGSVELVYRWVATIFRSAVEDRLIPASPCIRISLPKRDRRQLEPLTVEQVSALATELPDRLGGLVVFAAGMGLRQGECFGLTVDRVDFLRRQVRVDRQLIQTRQGIPEFGPPKTEASVRTVPMPQVIGDVLARHLATFGSGPEGLVFTNKVGRPLNRSAIWEVWHPAARRAALPTWATFHDLRHFYASLLIARGCSVKAIQRRLGHQSATETLDTYGHLWPDSDDETRDAVDHVLASLAVQSA